jgi:hypothetical protein
MASTEVNITFLFDKEFVLSSVPNSFTSVEGYADKHDKNGVFNTSGAHVPMSGAYVPMLLIVGVWVCISR